LRIDRAGWEEIDLGLLEEKRATVLAVPSQ
jgi:hypothetical protein